jgi:hypothetical protein
MAKCLDASTRIATRRGVVPASNVAAGDELWHENRWVLVEATTTATPKSGLLFTTVGGYHIKLTPEHRMLIDGGRLTAEWGGVPLMVEKRADAGSRWAILRGGDDGLGGHLLER